MNPTDPKPTLPGAIPQPGPDVPPPQSSLMARLRNYFLTGLIITGPVAITIWLTWSFVTWVDNLVRPLLPARYWPENILPFGIPGYGLVVALLALTLLGF